MGNNSVKNAVPSTKKTESNAAYTITYFKPKKDYSAMFRVSDEEVS